MSELLFQDQGSTRRGGHPAFGGVPANGIHDRPPDETAGGGPEEGSPEEEGRGKSRKYHKIPGALSCRAKHFMFCLNYSQRAAEDMKRRIIEADLTRKKSSALTDLEREAQERAQGVVERATLLQMEQDEEIRMLKTVRSSRGGRRVKLAGSVSDC